MLTFYDKYNLPVRVETGFIYISNLNTVGIKKAAAGRENLPSGGSPKEETMMSVYNFCKITHLPPP